MKTIVSNAGNTAEVAQLRKDILKLFETNSKVEVHLVQPGICLLYTSPSPRDRYISRMPSSA